MRVIQLLPKLREVAAFLCLAEQICSDPWLHFVSWLSFSFYSASFCKLSVPDLAKHEEGEACCRFVEKGSSAQDQKEQKDKKKQRVGVKEL